MNRAAALVAAALLGAAGLVILAAASKVAPKYRPAVYILGAALLFAALGLLLVILNGAERAGLGTGIHDGRSVGAGGAPTPALPQPSPPLETVAARLEVLGSDVYLEGVEAPLTIEDAAAILVQSLPPGSLVALEYASGLVEVARALNDELTRYTYRVIPTIRGAQARVAF